MKFSILLALFSAQLTVCCSPMKEESKDQLDIDIPMPDLTSESNTGNTSSSQTKDLTGNIDPPKDQGNLEGPEWQMFFQANKSIDGEIGTNTSSTTRSGANQDLSQIFNMARTSLALGHLDKAEKEYRKAIYLMPNNLEAPLEIAMIRIKKKQAQEAFLWLEDTKVKIESTEKAPQRVLIQYRYTLALAYDLAKNTAKSRKILADILRIDNKFAPGYTALAASYINRKKLDAADFVIKRGQSRIPNNLSLENLAGLILARRGQFDLASEIYRKILDKNPEFIPTLINKAILDLQNNDLEESERLLRKALALKEKHPEALSTLAALYMKKDRLSDAQGLLEQALILDPHNTKTRYNLALVRLYSESKPYHALRLFYEVLQTSSPEEDSIYKLAKTYIDDIKHANLGRIGKIN